MTTVGESPANEAKDSMLRKTSVAKISDIFSFQAFKAMASKSEECQCADRIRALEVQLEQLKTIVNKQKQS